MRDFAEFPFNDRQRGVVEAAASNRFGQVGSIEAHFDCFTSDLLPKIWGYFTLFFDFVFVGQKFLRDKSSCGISQHALFFSQFKIHLLRTLIVGRC